jgi:polysaccharide export outer membrane protein
VGDEFNLRVHDEKQLSGKYVVSTDGTINMPWINRVEVEGLTCSEIETKISKRLADGYLRTPTVSCTIEEYQSKRVYIFGEVQEPGSYSYTSNITVVEAIGMVGGMTERAAPNSAKLKRKTESGEVVVEIPLGDIVEGRQPDFKLFPGDIVFVPKAAY